MNRSDNAFAELEQGVKAALETYSNVHRGSGHFSMVTTQLFEKAREIFLEYMKPGKSNYQVIFCSPRYAEYISAKLLPDDHKIIYSHTYGLPFGICAIAFDKRKLPKGSPFYSGGGTTRLISPEWVIWANSPDKFEAGTPSIINVIAFARALQIIKQQGNEIFLNPTPEKLTVSDIIYSDNYEDLKGLVLLDKLRETMIGRGILVPTLEGPRPYINLDYSASTPTFETIWKSVCQVWRQPLDIQQEIIQEVRLVCAGTLGAPLTNYDIIFTSNTTEAINIAAENLACDTGSENENFVLNTLLEHSSDDLPWRFAANSVIRLSIDNEGFVDHNELEKILKEYNQNKQFGNRRIKIVAISGASNVLGSANDLNEIGRIVHQYGAQLLVDAAQLVAHRKIDVNQSGIDYLAFSAHKIYAPFGTGVLIVKKGLLNLNLEELKKIKSSGEENSGGIAALGKALILMQKIGMDLISEEEKTLTIKALTVMSQIDDIKIYGISDTASPRFDRKVGVIAFTLKGFMSDKIAKELSIRRGIGIRYGCHCAHMLVKHILGVPPSLERFQKIIATFFPRLRFPGVARISFGIGTTNEEIDFLAETLGKIAGKSTTSSRKNTEDKINDYVKTAVKRVYS